jgi:hypothetical protein
MSMVGPARERYEHPRTGVPSAGYRPVGPGATTTVIVSSVPIRTQEDPVDLVTFLTLAVAATIVSSGYFLFKGVPTFRSRDRRAAR